MVGDFMKRFVLVTGGDRGIGKSIVEKFAENSFNVIFTYLKNEELALELVSNIKSKYNVECYTFKCDISNEDDVKKLYDNIQKITDSLYAIINNAGISMDKTIYEKSVQEFSKVISVNLVGTYSVVKTMVSMLSEGIIVNIASNDGIDNCYKDEMDYAASKAGVISLTKTMAKEFAPKIRVNAVAPGWVETDMSKNDLENADLKLEKDLILLKRFAKPEEIANVVYFLCSDDASYINGEVIKVDGGY